MRIKRLIEPQSKKINIKKILALIILQFLITQVLPAQNKALIDISQEYLTSFVKFRNAKVELINEKSILIEMDKKEPLVELFAPNKTWDLHNNTSIAFNVKNIGSSDIALTCNIGDYQWCNGLLLLKPGESDVMRILIKGYRLPEKHPMSLSYQDMKGYPGGYLKHWIKMEATVVKKIKLSLNNAKQPGEIAISNIRAEGNLNKNSYKDLKKNAFPFVDQYGQYIHKQWKGKILSDDDLHKMIATENADLEASPFPANRSKYGGWTKGEKRKATGHFRTEKIDGKWWFIDPAGYLFWSHGITGVARGAAITKVAEREHYFTGLPDKDSPRFQFANNVKQNKIASFNFTASNLYLKYGENWKEKNQQMAHKRLKSWGMNTIGNWSDEETYMQRKTPYTVNVAYTWNKVGGILKFPDVFDPHFKTNLQKGFLEQSKTWNDDYCIGYFVNNELHDWGKIGNHVLALPANEKAKIELIGFLAKKYSNITNLNKAWNTSFKSWKVLLNSTQKPKGKLAFADVLDFEKIMVDLYYKTCKEVIKEKAPHKLYLGSRLHNHYYPEDLSHQKWIVRIAAKYCDVLSFNRYRFSPHDLKPHSSNIDKPIVIGEFHFGALDRGMLHTGLRSVQNQQQREKAYFEYIKAALENPYLVGAHWFQYGEQAVTGRGDGENYQIGFLDVCDNPYQETIDGARKIGYQMYEMRIKSNKKTFFKTKK